jgi:hypothetical protein
MKLKLQVVPADGEPYVVETNLFTIVAVERKFKVQASSFAQGISLEILAYMAYEASKQAGVTVPAIFDDFIKKTQNIEVIGEEPTNPTDAGNTDLR